MGRLAAAIGTLALLTAVGCGADEPTFSADELVADVEANGVGLELGDALTTDQEDIELYGLRLEGGGSGTLAIAADSETALDEYARCEATASLFCFRVANAVLVFDSEVPNQELARIGSAVEAMAD